MIGELDIVLLSIFFHCDDRFSHVHTSQNANAALVFEFAYRFINLGRSYFGKLDEDSVKNNFVCVTCIKGLCVG